MPRDGNGVYQLPAGSQAVTGETATAATHNIPIDDLEADANFIRPIVAGGTGANTGRGALAALGGASFDITRAITGNTTITVNDSNSLILVDASSGDVTVTLLLAGTAGDRFRFTLKRTDNSANTVTVERSGSDTIDGEETDTGFVQYEAREYHSNGTLWHKISSLYIVPDVPGIDTYSADRTGLITDQGRTLIFTADATYTLPDTADIPNGWRVTIKAQGGIVGLNPDGSLTIDGVDRRAIAQGTTVEAISDGSNYFILSDIDFRPDDVIITDLGAGTWTAPADARVRFTAIGPGGNGLSANGGGAGGLARIDVNVTGGEDYTLDVGARTVGSGDTPESTTVVGTGVNLSANGGFPGASSVGVASSGGTATGGDVNATGGEGGTANGGAGGGGSVGGLDPNGDGTNTGFSGSSGDVNGALGGGGAGVGGNAVSSAGTSGGMGGGSHGAASATEAGADIYGVRAAGHVFGSSPAGEFLRPLGGGGGGAIDTFTSGQGGDGGGGGGGYVNSRIGAAGGRFAGGGAGSVSDRGGAGGLGGGGGAAGPSAPASVNGAGGNGVIIVEYL